MANTTFENKELGIKVVIRKNYEWDEWQARVYIDGKFDDDATYYAGGGEKEHQEDAIDTGTGEV